METHVRPKRAKVQITDALIAAVQPHLLAAVRANVERWDAERNIEHAIQADQGLEGIEIDGILEAYEDLCVMTDAPEGAQVTADETRDFLEAVLEAR